MKVSFCSKIPKSCLCVCVWCVLACIYIYMYNINKTPKRNSFDWHEEDYQLIVHGTEVRLGQRQTRSVKNAGGVKRIGLLFDTYAIELAERIP